MPIDDEKEANVDQAHTRHANEGTFSRSTVRHIASILITVFP